MPVSMETNTTAPARASDTITYPPRSILRRLTDVTGQADSHFHALPVAAVRRARRAVVELRDQFDDVEAEPEMRNLGSSACRHRDHRLEQPPFHRRRQRRTFVAHAQ